ncbi:aminopeptidase P family protein [Moraxella nonliquefaciens]|jgi:M24 metallopeptidase family protein|uniref:aminopeptidase P family protein n=1 Tax=Moraxella nonliquefaciens TaxID=478 RepID=UPI00081ED446|nr:aminopeptidase P family protein [Moraxella nonliquefaciens]OBX50017.1 peptidase M24 [Moraxella nonliquefaciens]
MTDFHKTPSDVRRTRVLEVRKMLAKDGLSALIIPSADPHMSEYLPVYWQGRAWLSGFTGSVGTLVITQDFAGVWTDSRYWVQAPIELDGTGIVLQKMEQAHPTYAKFLADNLPHGAKVAIDGSVLSMTEFDNLNQAFDEHGIQLVIDADVLGQIWQDRPSLPNATIDVHDAAFVDASAKQKLTQVRKVMTQKGATHHLISSLDDVAWLTNLRGADVNFNPVFLSHLLITTDTATLFVHDDKLTDTAKSALDAAGIDVAHYDSVAQSLDDVDALLFDPAKVAVGTLAHLPQSATLTKAFNPSTILKAIKSDKELNHVREAMRQDGAALCEFFANLEDKLAQGERVSELDIDVMLEHARGRQPNHVSASFDTIAGFCANGAIVHYRATDERFAYLDGNGLLLIDSGAQYKNGTTDITRMAGIGQISDDEKRDVTYVLKAHIALASAHFPKDIPSMQLDVLARNQLWQQGLDYGHGTGHGVGYFLNVHEGPQVISRTAPVTPERIISEGMITSNEPGLYREGKWGIRLENLVVAVKASQSEFGEFLKFEDLTLCPFDTRLILPELLNEQEKRWLNDYHKRVHDELIGRVDGRAKAWLIKRTQAI